MLPDQELEKLAPDIDGNVEKGFTIHTDYWGHALDHWAGAVTIEPTWALVGK